MRTAVLEAKRARLLEIRTKRGRLTEELEKIKEEEEERKREEEEEEPDAKRRKEEEEQEDVLMLSDEDYDEEEPRQQEEEEEETKEQAVSGESDRESREKATAIPDGTPTAPELTNDDEEDRMLVETERATAEAARKEQQQPQQQPQKPAEKPTPWVALASMKSPEAVLAVHERVIRRATELRAAGMWLPLVKPRQPDPVRPKVHWDFLLEEAAWLAADFEGERRWKASAAAFLAAECASVVRLRREKLHKEYGRTRELAFRISRDVQDFWHGAAALGDLLAGRSQQEESNRAGVEMAEQSKALAESACSKEPVEARAGQTRTEAAEWLAKNAADRCDCVLCDPEELVGAQSAAMLLAAPATAPALVVVPRTDVLSWRLDIERFSGRSVGFYGGGGPLVPRLITLTTPDVAAAESAALGTVPWSAAVVLARSGSLASDQDRLVWDAICSACRCAATRFLICDSPPPAALTSKLLRGSPAFREWKPIRRTPKQRFVQAKLSRAQQELYDSQIKRNSTGDDLEQSAVRDLETLRSICDHPSLVSEAIAESPFVCRIVLDQGHIAAVTPIEQPLGDRPSSKAPVVAGIIKSKEENSGIPSIRRSDLAPPSSASSIVIPKAATAVSSTWLRLPNAFESRASSGKLSNLMVLLARLYEAGKRVAVVSHSAATRDLLEDHLRSSMFRVIRTDSTTNPAVNRIACHSFDCLKKPFVLLAGASDSATLIADRGVDAVVIFDCAWSPEKVQQLRDELSLLPLSSSFDAEVFWLFTAGTIEEFVPIAASGSCSDVVSTLRAKLRLDGINGGKFLGILSRAEKVSSGIIESGSQPSPAVFEGLLCPLEKYAVRRLSEISVEVSPSVEEAAHERRPLIEEVKEEEAPQRKEPMGLFHEKGEAPSICREVVANERVLVMAPPDPDVDEPYIPAIDDLVRHVIWRKKRKPKRPHPPPQPSQSVQSAESEDIAPANEDGSESESSARARDDDMAYEEYEDSDEDYRHGHHKRLRPHDEAIRQQQQQQKRKKEATKSNKASTKRKSGAQGHGAAATAAAAAPVETKPNCWTPAADAALAKVCLSVGAHWRFACDQVREATGRQITPGACFNRWTLLQQQRATTGQLVQQTPPLVGHVPYQRWNYLNDIWRRWNERNSIPQQAATASEELPNAHMSHDKSIKALCPEKPKLPIEISRATYLRIDTTPPSAPRVPVLRPEQGRPQPHQQMPASSSSLPAALPVAYPPPQQQPGAGPTFPSQIRRQPSASSAAQPLQAGSSIPAPLPGVPQRVQGASRIVFPGGAAAPVGFSRVNPVQQPQRGRPPGQQQPTATPFAQASNQMRIPAGSSVPAITIPQEVIQRHQPMLANSQQQQQQQQYSGGGGLPPTS